MFSPSIANHQISIALFLLTLCTFLLASVDAANARRQHKTHKKAAHPNSSDEYDYRVDDDYSIGVFVDAVPIAEKAGGDDAKKTLTNDGGKAYKRTNRYPSKKLRKFFDESKARREWYEALFSKTERR